MNRRTSRIAAAMLAMSVSCSLGIASGETTEPATNPGQVVAGHARFSILTPALIRMEWSPTSTFEDRPSFAFNHRDLSAPEFDVEKKDDWLTIDTGKTTLRYQDDGNPFNADNLSVSLELNGKTVTWKPGMKDTGNLGGTVRTLDGVNGSTELDPGIVSRDGWVLWDDSETMLFDTSTDWPWIVTERQEGALDWYFFGHGHDYKGALADFTKASGDIPLPPRYVFGSWWSRYWYFTDDEFKALVKEYDDHDVPLDILVNDMDWHLVGPQYPGNGWTGYTFNPKAFPDPKGFMDWLHERGLHTTLNLHPADGINKHEAAFADMAKALGLDPEKIDHIDFDPFDRAFVDAYFKYLHHPLERQGVDFWWMDWQQGTVDDIDPLFWLNYLHWTDMERNKENGDKRPMIFSRWGGLGNHRYQIGFSGDTHSTWGSLEFQPGFTSTASNVGYGFWSHDIGGHQPGPVEGELYARWIQLGALSPILRTHGTSNPEAKRRIWAFEPDVFDSARKAFHLRYALIPYIYTAAREAHDTGVSMCRPLYYEWPELDEAYEHWTHYMFGDDMLIVPVTSPVSAVSQRATVTAWMPPGKWTNWFTGQTYEGPGEVSLLVPLDEVPIFVREGGIIPAMPKMNRMNEKPVDPLILNIFPGESGETRVYEDDGISTGYLKDEFAWIPVEHHAGEEGRHYVTVGPIEGSYPGMLEKRRYEVRLRDRWSARSVTVNGERVAQGNFPERDACWYYDPATLSVVVSVGNVPKDKACEIVVTPFWSQDAAPLSQGIRGRLALVDDLVEILGENAPESLQKAQAVRAEVAANDLRSASDLMGDGWVKIIEDISKAKSPNMMQALSVALGLHGSITATGAGNDQIKVTSEIEIFEPLEGLTGDVVIETPPNWTVKGESKWEIKSLSPKEPIRFFTTLESKGAIQTTKLEGRIKLHRGETEFTIPISETLLPSINAWSVIGPFENAWDDKLDKPQPPEGKREFGATYPAIGGTKAAWKTVARTIENDSRLSEGFVVDFHKVFGTRRDFAVAYGVTYVDAPEAMDVVLALGSDDGVRVWVNKERVFENPAGRAYTPRQDKVNIKLRKGTNEVLFKVTQGEGEWAFGASLETEEGLPIPELKVKARP